MSWCHYIFPVAFLLGALEAKALPIRESLAMIESGATQPHRSAADRMRGSAGEVSRFQIMPRVWHEYTASKEYEDPDLAWWVAQQILGDRTKRFREKTGREPNAVELYLLWNKPGHFEAAKFDTARVKSLFSHRAQRFANLCEKP